MGTKKDTNIKFRIDVETKAKFLELCEAKGSTMSDELLKYINGELETEKIIKSNNKIVKLLRRK